jgi:cyclophilin family peptidyl-prolyl cis-trans isomerase
VVPGFVIQSGDPLGSGQGGPGYSIPDEYTGSDHYDVGVLAMANANRPDEGVTNTGGSQFFIVSGKEGANLDATPNYTVFGSVTKGLDVVKRIDSVPIGGPNGDTPEQAVYVETIAIKERAKPAPAPSPTVSASPSS